MRQIRVGKRVALVDDEDCEQLSSYQWVPWRSGSGRCWYASTRIGPGKLLVMMHQLVLGRRYIDHINSDGLDNRRSNLRPATPAENNRNRRKPLVGRTGPGNPPTSSMKGVYFDQRSCRFRAQITLPGQNKTTHIGYFADEDDAGRAYDREARRLYGEFAQVNFQRLE